MPTLIIICGTSFSGKTSLADHLAARFDIPQVDVDLTKEALFGAAVEDDDLSGADFQRMYDETDRAIERYLAANRSVIDASRNFRKRERAQARLLCRSHNAALLTIFVDTPESITRQRLLTNRVSRERRDVTDAGFDAILSAWEPPTDDEHPLAFRHGDKVDEWIETNLARLTKALNRPE
jgi:predicted kinase